MRLDFFCIRRFKNLADVEINFSENNWVTVLIGWNGTGKSNVLEALVILFRELELQKPRPPFGYRIEYRCRGRRIKIDANPERPKDPYIIESTPDDPMTGPTSALDKGPIEWKKISYAEFRKNREAFLPSYVFGYYSGPSNRLERHFDEHQRRFYSDLLSGKDTPMRPLFYARPVHSQFVLLAFMLRQDKTVQDFLFQYLGIDPNGGIDSVLFVMRQPSWKSPTGDPRFWNARGVVQRLLTRLYDVALAPIRLKHKVPIDFRRSETKEHLYLFVRNTSALRELVGSLPPHEFFKELESTYISELIAEVRIRVKLRKNSGAVEFRELSEGEQQLLTVLGLMRFTAEQESLFLLDEPDTHLNPSWAVDYLSFLSKFVGTDDTVRRSSHVVLTTHNPLAIAELSKSQVQVLHRNDETSKIEALFPEEDPRGMGYARIITSDMFGITSEVDRSTQKLLEEKRVLAVKAELSEQDRHDLARINAELEKLGFRFAQRDDEYERYLRHRYKLLQEKFGPAPDEKLVEQTLKLTRAEREKIAADVVKEILSEEDAADKPK